MSGETVPDEIVLPAGAVLVRTTPVFDETSVPEGLRRAHRVAAGVWGRLVVAEGSLRFVFEDDPEPRVVAAGAHQVIPPERPHHVEVIAPVRFVVEFHRVPEPDDGTVRA